MIDGTTTDSGSISGKLSTQIQLVQNGAIYLDTAISNAKNMIGGSSPDIFGNLSSLYTLIGGSGTLINNVIGVDDLLLTTPTGVLTTDLNSLRSLLVPTLSVTAQADIQSLNLMINGSAGGSTLQARIGSLGSASSVLGMIGDTTDGTVTSALGNTGAGNSSIASLLGNTSASLYNNIVGFGGILSQIDGTATDSGNISNKLETQIQSIQTGALQLSTAIDTINGLMGGSSSDIYHNLGAVNSNLDGVQSMSGLTNFVFTMAASNPGGNTVNIVGNDNNATNITYSTTFNTNISAGATFSFVTGPKRITFFNNSGSTISSAVQLASYLASSYPVGTIVTVNSLVKLEVLQEITGGFYNIMSNLISLDQELLITSTGVLPSDLATARSLLVTSPSSTLQNDIQTISSKISGTSSGSTIDVLLNNMATTIGGSSTDLISSLGSPGSQTIIDNIGGPSVSVQAGLNALATTLVNNTSFSTSLYNQVVSTSYALDNSAYSLPNGSTFGTVGTISSDGSGGVNVTIIAGGIPPGTYNISASSVISGVNYGNPFTLLGGSAAIVLTNLSGSRLSTQSGMLRYLQSMYPTTSKIVTYVSDKVSSINIMLGGSASITRAKIAAIDVALVQSPTGVVATDLAYLRGKIVGSLGISAEADVGQVSTLLGSGATNLYTAATNIEATINASSASNSSSGMNLTTFQNATTVYSQLEAFIALFNFTGATTLTFNFSTPPTSLAAIINGITSNT